jgi:G3E family GTPase
MFDQFNGGRDLLADDIDEEDIEALLIQQIEFCTTLVLNKADLVTEEQIAELRALVRGLQKDATIVVAENGKVDVDEMLSTDRFDFNAAYGSAAWMEAMEHPEEHEDPEVLEYDITTFVYKRRQPFDIDKFVDYVGTWPNEVIRTKGILWAIQDPNMCYLFEQAGRQFNLKQCGAFYATMPQQELMLLMAQDPMLQRDWDDQYGDRMQKLVFIGQNMDRDAITKALDNCLV